jgi:hypothetical protein
MDRKRGIHSLENHATTVRKHFSAFSFVVARKVRLEPARQLLRADSRISSRKVSRPCRGGGSFFAK